jgi:hypothetical protein
MRMKKIEINQEVSSANIANVSKRGRVSQVDMFSQN